MKKPYVTVKTEFDRCKICTPTLQRVIERFALIFYPPLVRFWVQDTGSVSSSCRSVIVSRVGTASVFDPVDFHHRIIPVKCAGESVLTDSELRERAASQWFEIFIGIAPFCLDDFVEF